MEDVTLVRVEPQQENELFQWIKEYYTYDQIPLNENLIRKSLPLLLQKNSPYGVAWFSVLANAAGENQKIGYSVLTYSFDLEFGGRMATITDLYLKPELRGQGLGNKVIKKILNQARDQGLGEVELQVEYHNEIAQKFYLKSGFRKIDRHTMTISL